jgi:peptidase S24-like protein
VPFQPQELLTRASPVEPKPELVGRVGCELIAEALRAGREVRLRVTGSSMIPSLWPGDTLTVRASGERAPSIGEVLLFERDGRLFAHRVVERASETRLITRGDSLPCDDHPVAIAQVLGSVTAVSRNSRTVAAGLSQPKRAMRLLSFAARHSDLLRRVILKLHAILSRDPEARSVESRVEGPQASS